jgi:hypothetical protein
VSDRAAPRVEVSIGDIHGSQLIVGDHNTIQTPEGTEVTLLQVAERPAPRLRRMPVSHRPSTIEILGREEESALVASASAGMPIQLYAEDGAGKTSLLKSGAQQTSAPAEGVVFEPMRHRSLDEIEAKLYAAFWECDVPFIPDPAQIGDFLADREALLILDDCGLDRGELETLLDRLPRCTVVIASDERTLWSRGTARGLSGLDPVAAIGLLERELGHALDPDERAAAETVVAQLGCNPQSLVETATLIEDGGGSLRDLADDPVALAGRFDPSVLTDSQKRILEILSALDGAALGDEHIAALAGLPDARPQLRELERRGWAKAASPRYRSVRRLPPDAATWAQTEIAQPLLAHLTARGWKAAPEAIADEAEAIERALELGVAAERWRETLALSLAAERGLLVAGAWSSCRRVLSSGLRAAGALGDESARAYLLHQLGSRALCLGDRGEAAADLGEALQIREGLGERQGADLTRHNLAQLGGGGDDGPDSDGGGSGGPPRMAIALAGLAVVVGIVAALALAGGDSGDVTSTDPTKPTVPPAGEPPAIAIESPAAGETFDEGDPGAARFHCISAEDTEMWRCEGAIDGTPVEPSDPLVMSAGEHTLSVTAIDEDGRKSPGEVDYSVEPPPPPTDNTVTERKKEETIVP